MHTPRWLPRTIGLAAVSAGTLLAVPAVLRAQTQTQSSGGEVVQQAIMLQTRDLAEQLGIHATPQAPDELPLGGTLNGSLEDPAKLEQLGLSGLHKGARVTAFRASAQKMIVEVDEIEPAPLSRKATLRVDERGRLVAP